MTCAVRFLCQRVIFAALGLKKSRSGVSLGSSNSAGHGHADHGVVAGADQTHHLDVVGRLQRPT